MHRSGRLILASAVLFSVATTPALTAAPCAGVDRKLTQQRKADYAALVAKSVGNKVKPSRVEIDTFLQSGDWSVVYATTPIADPGYFFFDHASGKPVFKDVWGGIADDGDGPVLKKWARDLGVNKEIAACFTHVVMDE